MYDGRKPQHFGNDRHTIACELLKIMWFAEIVEGKYPPCGRVRPEFYEIGKTVVTMLRCTRPICNRENLVIMDSGFCVTKGLVKLRKKGVFGTAIIKKRRYWLANIKGDTIDARFYSKEVVSFDAVN